MGAVLLWTMAVFDDKSFGEKLLNGVRLIPVMPSKHLSYCNNTKNLVALCQCKSF